MSQTLKQFNERIGIKHSQGIPVSEIEKKAKQLSLSYLDKVPENTFEARLMYGMVVAKTKQKNDIIRFSEIASNWAEVDMSVSRWKFIKDDLEGYKDIIQSLILSKKEYKQRIGYVMLLTYYLKAETIDFVLSCLELPCMDDYYAMMGCSWLISMGLIQFPDVFDPWLKQAPINNKIYQKALQKAIESKRCSEQKRELYHLWKNKKHNSGILK